MKITITDKNNNATVLHYYEGQAWCKSLLDYNDDILYFEVPGSVRVNFHYLNATDKLFLFDRLRFLVMNDYSLYLQSNYYRQSQRLLRLLESEEILKSMATRDEGVLNPDMIQECCSRITKEYMRLLVQDQLLEQSYEDKNIQYSYILKAINAIYRRKIRRNIDAKSFFKEQTLQANIFSFNQLFKSKNHRLSFSDDMFLIWVLKSFYQTNGHNRSIFYFLYTLIDSIGSFPQLNKQKSNNGMVNLIINSDSGLYRIESRNISIDIDTQCQVAISSQAEASDAILQDIREVLQKEYMSFVANNKQLLEEEFIMDCKMFSCTSVLSSELWSEYRKGKQKEWYAKLRAAGSEERFSPDLCFYYLILNNEESTCFESKSFLESFFLFSRHNNPFKISPTLFKELYRFQFINCNIELYSPHLTHSAQKERELQLDNKLEAIHKFLEPIVNLDFLNEYVIDKQSTFFSLVDKCIKESSLSTMLEKKNKNEISLHSEFRTKVIENLLGVFFLMSLDDRKRYPKIFRDGITAKSIAMEIEGDRYKENHAQYISKVNDYDDKFTVLSDGDYKKIQSIASTFINLL